MSADISKIINIFLKFLDPKLRNQESSIELIQIYI